MRVRLLFVWKWTLKVYSNVNLLGTCHDNSIPIETSDSRSPSWRYIHSPGNQWREEELVRFILHRRCDLVFFETRSFEKEFLSTDGRGKKNFAELNNERHGVYHSSVAIKLMKYSPSDRSRSVEVHKLRWEFRGCVNRPSKRLPIEKSAPARDFLPWLCVINLHVMAKGQGRRMFLEEFRDIRNNAFLEGLHQKQEENHLDPQCTWSWHMSLHGNEMSLIIHCRNISSVSD